MIVKWKLDGRSTIVGQKLDGRPTKVQWMLDECATKVEWTEVKPRYNNGNAITLVPLQFTTLQWWRVAWSGQRDIGGHDAAKCSWVPWQWSTTTQHYNSHHGSAAVHIAAVLQAYDVTICVAIVLQARGATTRVAATTLLCSDGKQCYVTL
jgi:hypothetical protein